MHREHIDKPADKMSHHRFATSKTLQHTKKPKGNISDQTRAAKSLWQPTAIK